MGDIRYYGGKITITATTSPSGHKIETAQDCVLPAWVTDVVTGETWYGEVGKNEENQERTLNLKVKVTTDADPNYEGVATAVSEWNLIQEAKNVEPSDYDQCIFDTRIDGSVECHVGVGCYGSVIDETGANDLTFRPEDKSTIYAACGFNGDINQGVMTAGESLVSETVYYKDASKVTIDFLVNFDGDSGTDWSCSRVLLKITLLNQNTGDTKIIDDIAYYVGSSTPATKEIDLVDWWVLNGHVNMYATLEMTFLNN